VLDIAELQRHFPQISHPQLIAAIYSPQDRQVDPVALTLALVEGARKRGVRFEFGTTAQRFKPQLDEGGICQHICTNKGEMAADWFVISTGLGSTSLTSTLNQTIDIRPVLGQALQVQLEPVSTCPEPVVTGDDVHVVPLGQGKYWIGATVEFAKNSEVHPDPSCLETVMQQAIAFYPAIASAKVIKTWYGLRPRPEGRPAPIIEPLPGYPNVLIATGHYRNGVLLAPATAQAIREVVEQKSPCSTP
jgi:glycine/D-amino acid oxidase-like deaminating enzyme